MAKDKKGFLLYADQRSLFEKLPNDKAGELIKLIFSYVNDENPVIDDLLLEIAFEPIKLQLKRDLKEYERIKSVRKTAGLKGGRPTKKQTEAKKANGFSEKQTEAKKPVIVNGNVNDSVSVKENVKEKENIYIKTTDFSFEELEERFNNVEWLQSVNSNLQMGGGEDMKPLIALRDEFLMRRKLDGKFKEMSLPDLRNWFVNFVGKKKELNPSSAETEDEHSERLMKQLAEMKKNSLRWKE
jgi:hypothetical protein